MQKQVIVRTVVLFLLLVNQLLIMFGANPLPFSEEQLYEGVSAVATVGVTVWAWWKNNSFTQAGQEADVYLKSRKEQLKE